MFDDDEDDYDHFPRSKKLRGMCFSGDMPELPSEYIIADKINDEEDFRRKFLDLASDPDINVSVLRGFIEKYGRHDGFPYWSLRNKAGNNALHLAALEGKTEVCEYLLEDLNFDINITNNRGNTPLFQACRFEKWRTAVVLINNGADVTISNLFYSTALHLAAMRGNADIVKMLLNRNANPNAYSERSASPLSLSITAGSIECMELLLKAKANPNEECQSCKSRPLVRTTRNIEMINCLLKHGANPNMPDSTGTFAIEKAALKAHDETVKHLLPNTSPITGYSDWSFSGIKQNVPSESFRKLRKSNMEELCKERKLVGNEEFRLKNFHTAMNWYNEAIDADPTVGEVYSNRSYCWLHLGNAEAALADARTCIELKPRWVKGYFREGKAWMALENFQQAAKAFSEALALKPRDVDIQQALRSAQAGLNNG